MRSGYTFPGYALTASMNRWAGRQMKWLPHFPVLLAYSTSSTYDQISSTGAGLN
jgi:hypothetical protein